MKSMLRIFLLAGMFTLTATVSRGESEIVITIRYLQAKGTSHSHLYLYREDRKLLRQLTNDDSGQDSDPMFSPDGETIVFTREKPNDTRELWSIDPRGTKLKKLDAAPDWYSAMKSSPAPKDAGQEESSASSPTPPQQEPASPAETDGTVEQGQHQSATALDAVTDAEDRPPQIIKAPDGSGEIFWRKGKEGEGPEEPLNWVMWFRDLKSGKETEIGRLPAFPSFEPLQVRRGKGGQFLFDGPARFVFFSTHLDSQSGSTVVAFDFNKRKLVRLSPNWATPIPLPGGSRVPHAHRKSLRADSRHDENCALFVPRTLGCGYQRRLFGETLGCEHQGRIFRGRILARLRRSDLRRRPGSALCAQKQCRDLLWRIDVPARKGSCCHYDPQRSGLERAGQS